MIETHWALQQSENAYWSTVISLFDRMGNKADSGVETGVLRWENCVNWQRVGYAFRVDHHL